MHLIYVNEIGSDYKGQKQYEFVFSESYEIDMDEWFTIPASLEVSSKSPDVEYVDTVGLLKDTDLQLELDAGANVNTKDKNGKTPWEHAKQSPLKGSKAYWALNEARFD